MFRLPAASSAHPPVSAPARPRRWPRAAAAAGIGAAWLLASLALAEPAAANESAGGGGMIALMQRLALQIGVLLMAARLLGEVVERYLKQPAVLGELAAGILIGPYAFGHRLVLPHVGPLFPPPPAGAVFAVSPELNGFAAIGAILLLFKAGLETDLAKFLEFGPRALVIAAGGVVAPFALGAWATVACGYAGSFAAPSALFMGAVMTATSVGITARVLTDLDRLDTAEGVTVLAAAVIDDVLGILVLAIVVSAAAAGQASAGDVALIGARAVGVWLGVTVVALAAARWTERGLRWFKGPLGPLAPTIALVLLVSALVELAGLAMIIGAYVAGLAIGKTGLREPVEHAIEPVTAFLVPVFFGVMGTLVNFGAMTGALGLGVVISALAVLSKVVGCGLPALGLGFNGLGAARIGVGMLPRGEVALIVAGVGLAAGIVQDDLFGVAVLMTAVTTLLAPVLLVPLFRSRASGLR